MPRRSGLERGCHGRWCSEDRLGRDKPSCGDDWARGPCGSGVEAVVDRDVARQRVVDARLHLERMNLSPAIHMTRPLDGMNPDIGTTIQHHEILFADQSPALVWR